MVGDGLLLTKLNDWQLARRSFCGETVLGLNHADDADACALTRQRSFNGYSETSDGGMHQIDKPPAATLTTLHESLSRAK
jgi:hypothetical protein